jgi:hypothetical protein
MEQRRGPQHDPLAVECRVGLALLRLYSSRLRRNSLLRRAAFREVTSDPKNVAEQRNANTVRNFGSCIICQYREVLMHSKLLFSALVVASLFGTSAIAAAQTQPIVGASDNSNAMAYMGHHKMKSHHHARYTRAAMDRSRPGGRPISRKPPP